MIEVYLLKYYFESHFIYDAIIENNFQSIKCYGILRKYNWSMSQCCNFMRNLCDARLCEVAALSFQANSNYGTWSIDFA